MDKGQNRKVIYTDLGLISYTEALDVQTLAFNSIIDVKVKNREMEPGQQLLTDNFLFFCEHPHVYTLGRGGAIQNLLISEEVLKKYRAEFYKSTRGGDITYHGPGQLVGYPVFDLDNFFTDIHRYMRTLEEAVILSLKYFGIEAGRIQGLTGVWVNAGDPARAKKICALGVKTSRWVTMHGFSLNVHTDLSYFDHIVPCGISDKSVTSMERELGHILEMAPIRDQLQKNLYEQFGITSEQGLKTTIY
jgi:lipoyl(octanoyl) transferase